MSTAQPTKYRPKVSRISFCDKLVAHLLRINPVQAVQEECFSEITVKLSNGVDMPLLHLGTAQRIRKLGIDCNVPDTFRGMLPERVYRQVEVALQNGLRAFDSALVYRNQSAIGDVWGEWFRTGRLSGRQDVWVTTKVFHPNSTGVTFGMQNSHSLTPEQITEDTWGQFEKSLVQLGVGYVDLVLLHWPSGDDKCSTEDNRQRNIAAWRVLESVYSKGLARAIGVSNFTTVHLEQLKQDGASVMPMVNQIEASVTLQHRDIVKYCHFNGIVPQAYSPFGRGLSHLPPELQPLAAKYGKNVGQIAIKYLIQLGYAVVFLSNSADRMVSNHDIFDFELTTEEMTLLGNLSWPNPSPRGRY